MAITAEFTADFSQFTAATQGAQDSLANLKDAAAGMALDHQAEMAGRAIGALTTQITSFARDYINAFAEEEAATTRLTSALQAQGTASTETIAHYQAMAEQFQRTTRYSDDAVTAAQTAFVQIGRIGPEQMQPAMQAAADLAASLGISLPEAAQKIATVIGTDGAKLGSLKAMLGDVDVKGKSAAEVLEIFNKKFGGAAAADMQTTAGQMANLTNKLEDMKSKIGDTLNQALKPFLEVFSGLPPELQSAIALVTDLGTGLIPIAMGFGKVVAAVTPLVTLLGGAGGIGAALATLGAALTGPVALAIGGFALAVTGVYLAFKNWDKITAFVKGVYDGIKTYLVDGFNALVDQILAPIRLVEGGFKMLYDQVVGHSYVPDMIAGIGAEFAKLNDVMVKPAQFASDATAKAFDGVKQALASAMQGGVQLPGSRIEQSGFVQTLISPEGYRVPMERTATGNSVMPANWWAMYTGRESSPLNSMFTGTELATAANNRPPPVIVNVSGNVLSTKDELSSLVQDAMMQAYRQGGNLLPV